MNNRLTTITIGSSRDRWLRHIRFGSGGAHPIAYPLPLSVSILRTDPFRFPFVLANQLLKYPDFTLAT